MSDLLSPVLFALFFVAAIAATLKPRSALYFANDVFSSLVNWCLLCLHPIRHINGDRFLPTCNYRFPNGQGDVDKFLEGMRNSEEWEKKNGSVYRIWSGRRPEVVLTRPEHIQAVFKDSDKHSKAVNNNSGYLMSEILGKCVGLISGKEWRAVRASVEPPFVRKNSATYVELVEKHVHKHFTELQAHGKLAHGLLDPADDLKLLPFWIVAEIIYGELSPEMVSELRSLAPIREHLFKYVIRGGLSRFWLSRFLPTQANKTLTEFRARWEAFNDVAYHRAKKLGTPAPIVRMYEAAERGVTTHDQLLQTLDESLYANLDVTTGGISWNLIFLAAYPHYQASLLDESSTAVSRDQHILSSSTLLAACVSESSRLKPLAAFSVPQSAPTERVIDGYIIPRGTDFIVDSYALNIRNEFWGSDSAAYRPQRFLERSGMEMRYHFWRFGFGPRQCMGRYVADLIIRCIILHLVHHYELSLLDGSAEWGRNPETWINHPQMEIRCEKKVPN